MTGQQPQTILLCDDAIHDDHESYMTLARGEDIG